MQSTLKLMTATAGLLATMMAGCGSGSATNVPPQGTTTPPGTGTGAFQELIAYDWMIGPGVEQYYCVYKTLTQDLWVSQYRPLLPTGTHHVTVGYGDPGPPDGAMSAADTSSCNGLTLGAHVAFAATRGTDALSMPAGVGVKIPAGQQLLLSVHVLNPTQQALAGRTGIEVAHADPTQIQHQAELIFANNQNLMIPPGTVTQQAMCTLDADSTIPFILGHMHLTGTHFTAAALPVGRASQTLLDENYLFDSQKFVALAPQVALKKGDQIQTECTYQNPGPDTLTFGESTTKNEMCISIFYRYPAQGTNFDCTQ
jgi:hypothetical protein